MYLYIDPVFLFFVCFFFFFFGGGGGLKSLTRAH